MYGAIPPLQYTFMAWCSVKKKKHRENFTFTMLKDLLTLHSTKGDERMAITVN